MSFFNQLIAWTTTTFQPLGSWGLFILAFIESSFFPIPPDILLLILSLADPSQALWYAAICTIGSVLGGMFGYFIGNKGGLPLLEKFLSHEKISRVHRLFQRYETGAIAIAGFTPVPYKVFTIAAGVFYIKFWKFVWTSLWSRGARFFLEAVLLMFYGAAMVSFIDRYFDVLSFTGAILLVGVYLVYRHLKKRRLQSTTFQR